MHNVLGGVIDAHASYLLLRGMKTLGLRVEHQNRCASSTMVAAQPAVFAVKEPPAVANMQRALNAACQVPSARQPPAAGVQRQLQQHLLAGVAGLLLMPDSAMT
jgi:hypothetical protein